MIAGNDDAIRAAAMVAGALAEACRAGKGADQKESDFEVKTSMPEITAKPEITPRTCRSCARSPGSG